MFEKSFQVMHYIVKKYFFLVFLALCLSYAEAERFLVHKTVYFDIIYAQDSEKTAALIAEHADVYAEEISSKLNKKIIFRMPVFIAPNQEVLNGYFTFFPYPQIAVFDTVPEDGALGSLEDIILKVFYHELTHAITLIYFLPVLPLSFTEGVAVLYESSDGVQGRLNDPLIYHHLAQGKIDGETPSWKEAAGHRDVYPGAFWGYIYGAAFADYLQKTYGMERYARYWHNSFFMFPKSKTKHIFHKRLPKLWNAFIETIRIPPAVTLPQPFLAEHNQSGFTVTASTRDGFACFDFAKSAVYFYTVGGKQEKLFDANPTLSHLSFSQDGRYLLITDRIKTLQGEKSRASFFDMERKKFLNKDYRSIRYASFCGNHHFCGIEVHGQTSELVVIDAVSYEKQRTLLTAGPGNCYTAIYNPVFAGNDRIACIAANGVTRDILLINIVTGETEKIIFEKPLPAIRYLQTNNDAARPVLTFSWAEKGMLYRAGIYDVKTHTLKVLEENISGGVFFPVLLPEQTKEKSDTRTVVYAGVHARYNSLYTVSEEAFTEIAASVQAFTPETGYINNKELNIGLLHPKRYHYASWLWRVFPIIYPAISADASKPEQTGLAVNLYGNDPTNLFRFQTSSVFYFQPFFHQFDFNLDIRSSPVSFSVRLYDENRNFAFRRIGSTIRAAMNIPTKNRYQYFSVTGSIAADAFSFFKGDKRTLYDYPLRDPVFSEQYAVGYSYIKTKPHINRLFFVKEQAGVSLQCGVKHSVHIPTGSNACVVQAASSFYLPVVPIRIQLSGYSGWNAYYAPQTGLYRFFNGSLFLGLGAALPGMSEYAALKKARPVSLGTHHTGFGIDGEITLFSYDIQTGSEFLPIFYNRLTITAGYKAVSNLLSDRRGSYSFDFYQSVYGKLYVTISGVADVGLTYMHPIEDVKIGKFDILLNVALP